jgi:AcrR family transcriptional regulator
MTKDEIMVQTILTTAKELIERYGTNKTTMEDIARHMGKGKSTLYYYFKSKNEIFNELIKREIDHFFETLKETVEQTDGATTKLKMYIITKINTIKDNENMYRFAIETNVTLKNNDQGLQELIERYDTYERKMLSEILSEGIETGGFHTSNTTLINELAELLVACLRGIELDVVTRNKFERLEEKTEQLVSLIAKGLN